MNENRSFQVGTRSCLVELAITLLAVCIILAISLNYRNFGDEYACHGHLGIGFPVSFLCDYGTGGSPIGSWGKVDLADFPYFSLRGLFTDILFYSVILWIGWLIRRAFRQNDLYRIGNIIWVPLIGIGFLVGFLSAAMIYKSDRVNFHDYILGIPSAESATPTPFGIPPPPAASPIPTLEP